MLTNLFLAAATVKVTIAIGVVLIIVGAIYMYRRKMLLGAVLLIIGILLLAGSQPMLDTAQALAGRRAVTHTDANGITVVVTPATPGLIPPVAESLAAVAAAIGMPILALWIRTIGKAAQVTANTVA